MGTITITAEHFVLLLSLVPMWARVTVRGLDPTLYGTGSYEKDLKIVEEIENIILSSVHDEYIPKYKLRKLVEEMLDEDCGVTDTITRYWAKRIKELYDGGE